jgi:hypothetical protein
MIFGVSLIVLFFWQVGFDMACGPEPDPYDYYTSFFHNTVQRNQDYWSFYFNGYTFLNDNENRVSETDINVKEWACYFGNRVKFKDVDRILYHLNRKTDSLYFWNYSNTRKLPDTLSQNTFIKALLINKDAMGYVALVKKTEPLVIQDYDDKWKAIPFDRNRMLAFSKLYLEKGIKEKDRFLKLRFLYQTQRLLHYAGYNKEALTLYNKYLANYSSKSHVKGWALSLKAGEELRLGRPAEAAYLFAKVFAGYPERRVQAYYSFSEAGAPPEQVAKLAKGGSEKAFIYAVNGFHNPHIGLSALENVYDMDPNSELINVLLVREINKIEEGYLTPRINGSKYYGSIGYYEHAKYDSVKHAFIRYMPQLKAFSYRLALEGRYKQPAIGCLAAAYISWIQGNTAEGLSALDRMKNEKLNKRLYDQKQLIKLLLLAQSIKKIDRASENELLPSLTWLDKKVSEEKAVKVDSIKFYGDYDLKYYSASCRDFYQKVLSQLYFKQKDTIRAALCILKSERTIWPPHYSNNDPGLGFEMPAFWQNQMHSYHLKQVLKSYQHKPKTAYFSLLMKNVNERSVAGIYHLMGTAYLREHRYRSAASAFRHVPTMLLDRVVALANDSTTQYANPFTSQLRDFPRIYQQTKPRAYNQLYFALEMARLEDKVKKDSKNSASYYFAMANGMYNTSYYGNAWYFTAYSRESDDIKRNNSFYYDINYLRCYDAEQYFFKARQASTNQEFRARCTFMAAKCRQKRVIYPTWPDYDDNQKVWDSKIKKFYQAESIYYKKFKQNVYYNNLRSHYSITRFYKTAIHECSYLRDFINAKR